MENNNPTISVIVPVYNAEKYLSRCIDSILVQTFTCFELLLVDDGSTDCSGRICDEYAKRDTRIRVIHKENGGVSSARQIGIDNAYGIYSIHVDSDDWVSSDMLYEMYNKIEKDEADILISDFYTENVKGSFYQCQKTQSKTSFDILTDILRNNLFGSLWNKLIRHSLYKEYNVRFIKGVDYCEDVLVLSQLLLNDLRISFIHKGFYHYEQFSNDSITRNYTEQTYLMRKKYVSELEKILPIPNDVIISEVAFQVKLEAFNHNKLSEDEFYGYYKTPLSTILAYKYGRKIKICLVFAYFHMFKIASLIKTKI